jgi:flagellar hook-basal body complex protein FliE
MNIAATAHVTAGIPSQNASLKGARTDAEPFSGVLKDTIASVNQLQNEASSAATGLMTGSGVDVHQATIAAEKASMAFELVLAVRNKAVQAYQQVMSMQF